MLTLNPSAYDAIAAHCIGSFPAEVCGMFDPAFPSDVATAPVDLADCRAPEEQVIGLLRHPARSSGETVVFRSRVSASAASEAGWAQELLTQAPQSRLMVVVMKQGQHCPEIVALHAWRAAQGAVREEDVEVASAQHPRWLEFLACAITP
jgi:hypothetical protein